MGGPLVGGDVGGNHHPKVETDVTGMVRVAADLYLVPQFSMGSYFLYTSLSAKHLSGSLGILSVGMVFKGVFGNPRVFQIRGGVTIGYQYNQLGFGGVDQSGNGIGGLPAG
jgi:hypothetical protein